MDTTDTLPPAAQNVNATLFECRDDAGEYDHVHNYFLIVGSSFILIFGTGGNLVTYKVFTQSVYKHNVMASMFRYLSVLDLVFIWTMVTQFQVKGLTGYRISDTLSRGCLLVKNWSQILMSLANWLLVVITLARLVHIKCPLKTHIVCSKLNYNLLLIATHLFVIGIHGGIMLSILSRLTEADFNSGETCYYHVTRLDVKSKTQRWIYVTVNFLGPAFLLVIFNTMLIIELRSVQMRRQRRLNQTHTTTSHTGKHASGPAENFTTQDRTTNALGSVKTLVPYETFNAPQCNACDGLAHRAHHCELALHELWCDDHGGDTLTSLSPGTPLEAHIWDPLDIEKNQRSGYSLSQGMKMRTKLTTTQDRVNKQTFSSDDASGTRMCHAAFYEREVDENVIHWAESSCVKLPNANGVLGDSNWNQSDEPAPRIQLSPGDPNTARSNTTMSVTEGSHKYLDVSVADGSEVTSKSSRSQVASTGKLSVRTWISELRSHGVDMVCEEDLNAKSDVQESIPPVREQDDAVISPENSNIKPGSRTHTLTLMLITASAMFFILNGPFWLIYFGAFKSLTHNPSIGCSLRYMVDDIVMLLRYSNNSVNFIFYCAVGSRFRRDFFLLFRNLCDY